MNKKTIIITLATSSVFTMMIGMSYSYAADQFNGYRNDLQKSTIAQGDFETINSEKISNRDFQFFVANQTFVRQQNHLPSQSLDQITHDFNKQYASYLEAKKENVVVTDQEAQDYANKMRTLLSQPDSSVQGLQQVKDLITNEEKGLQISDNDFWTNIAPKQYKMQLSIAKLKDKFTQSYKQLYKSPSQETINKAWDNQAEGFLQQASIVKR